MAVVSVVVDEQASVDETERSSVPTGDMISELAATSHASTVSFTHTADYQRYSNVCIVLLLSNKHAQLLCFQLH